MIYELIRERYRFVNIAFKMNMKGISDADSLLAPSGNSINWIVGHLLATRNSICKLLNCDPIMTPEQCEPYSRGSDAGNTDDFIPLKDLMKLFKQSQQTILDQIAELTDEQLTTPIPTDNENKPDTLANQLLFFNFHEAYHVGQIGMMRRLIGKEGAI
jgi:uncharacterized damage-inducible protein DinB